jgi:hypothetical protein
MESRFSRAQQPEPPLPQPTPPSEPAMVYVYEDLRWEYKCITWNVEKEGPRSERELNALGADGWELAGIASLPNDVYFYFKRLQSSSSR